MTNEQKGILIAIIMLTVLITPIIISVIKIKLEEKKYKPKRTKDEKINKQQMQQPMWQQQIPRQPIQQQIQQQQIPQQPIQPKQNTVIHKYVPYTLIGSVLTNYEKLLYSILAPFCSKYNFILLSKVRIADFVTPLQQNNRSNFNHWFNRIASKHVDFLICQPQTFRPLVAIELDDYTHKYKSRQERDIFVDDVYASVGLPVLHITQLQENNIVRQLSEILNINLAIDNAVVQ